MIGDVLFFKKSNTFISNLIARITRSEYTHVGLISSYDEMTGVATIIESNRFIKTKISRIQLDDTHLIFSISGISESQRNLVVKYAYNRIGSEYDYFQILGLFLSLVLKGERKPIFNSSNKIICSELIDMSFYESGIHRKNTINIGNITPQELIECYELKDVRKGL